MKRAFSDIAAGSALFERSSWANSTPVCQCQAMTDTDSDRQPLESHSAGTNNHPLPRCKQRVPAALCNGLKGDDAPRCVRRLPARGVPHTGNCKAARGIPRVGRTEWTWKPAGTVQPESVKLAVPRMGVSASDGPDVLGLL